MVFYHTGKSDAELMDAHYQDGLCQEKVLATYTLPAQMTATEMGYIFADIVGRTPSKSHSLIIGSHGLGWIPIGAEPESSAAYMGKTGKAHTPTHEELWERKGDIVTRYLGEDTCPQNRFDVTDLAEAIASTGVKMEYILFDACFMANVESAYELRNSTSYIIGSVCEIMGSGFPYNTVLPEMLTNGGKGYNLDGICRAFNSFYKENYGYSGSIATMLPILFCSRRSPKR